MVNYHEFAWFVDQSAVYRLPCGWIMAVRVDWCEATAGRPQGISYGLVLNDEHSERILGFDNSHQFDGAGPDDPFDHEHRSGKTGQRFRYDFVSATRLWDDFLDRVEQHCERAGVTFALEMDDD